MDHVYKNIHCAYKDVGCHQTSRLWSQHTDHLRSLPNRFLNRWEPGWREPYKHFRTALNIQTAICPERLQNTTTNMEEYSASVSSSISKCQDDETSFKAIATRASKKLWMTAELCLLFKNLRQHRPICHCSTTLKKKYPWLLPKYPGNKAHVGRHPGYKATPHGCDDDALLPDALNGSKHRKTVRVGITTSAPNYQVSCLTAVDTRKILSWVEHVENWQHTLPWSQGMYLSACTCPQTPSTAFWAKQLSLVL